MNKSDIESIITLRNNEPLDDFDGLSPNEMHHMTHDTFSDNSLVKLSADIDDEALDRISFFRIAEELLKIIAREKKLKLTATGALPKKVVTEIYAHKFITDYMIEAGIYKLGREDDFIAIVSVHITIVIAHLAKKRNGWLSLTLAGSQLMHPQNRLQLFKIILTTYTTRINWGMHDGYPYSAAGQIGWAYSIFLLNRYGDKKRSIQFYSDKYIKAFQKFISWFDHEHSSSRESYASCYYIRTMERFLSWFGFVTLESHKGFSGMSNVVIPTALMHLVFSTESI